MKFDTSELFKQMGDMAMDDILSSLPDDNGDAQMIKKYLEIFSKHGVSKLVGFSILKDIAELSADGDRIATKYVCKHCGKRFDKDFEHIESVLAYHMQSEHADRVFFNNDSLIEDHFTEE